MKKFALPTIMAGTLAVTACGPGVPIELPEDALDAARICFAAKGLVLREGKGEDAPITYQEFVETIKYPMIAVSQSEPFDIDSVGSIFEGAEAVGEDVATKDYEGVIADCDARFPSQEVTLPEEDKDAVLSCTAMTGFLSGAVQADASGFGGRDKDVNALMARLEAAMEGNPDLLVMMIQGDPEEIMNAALQSSFATGNVDGFISQCQTRFPAKGEITDQG